MMSFPQIEDNASAKADAKSQRFLIIGGSGSGKSAFAERLAVEVSEGGPLFYVATMFKDGSEAERRIKRHRALRSGKGFKTIECPVDVGGALHSMNRVNTQTECPVDMGGALGVRYEAESCDNEPPDNDNGALPGANYTEIDAGRKMLPCRYQAQIVSQNSSQDVPKGTFCSNLGPLGREGAEKCAPTRYEITEDKLPTVLLESLSDLAANEFFRDWESFDKGEAWNSFERRGALINRACNLAHKLLSDILELSASCRNLIIVTDDIFRDGSNYSEETEAYRGLLGFLHCALAGSLNNKLSQIDRPHSVSGLHISPAILNEFFGESDYLKDDIFQGVSGERLTDFTVYEVVCGIPGLIKGEMIQGMETEIEAPEMSSEPESGPDMEKARCKLVIITGGAFQGKLAFAKKLQPSYGLMDASKTVDFTDWVMNPETGGEAAPYGLIIDHFEGWFRRRLSEGGKPEEEIQAFFNKDSIPRNIVLISDEVGSGVVPIERDLREFRERLGRCLMELADRSDRVYRVFAGKGVELR